MQNIWLCDIDGTIAHNNGHRSFYDESRVFHDEPLPTVEIIKSLIKTGDRIIYFSGRTEDARLETIKWLTKYIDDSEPELYMRKSKDNRSDDIVKEEMYNVHIKGIYNISGVFDDRLKVCRMWYKLGIFVLNCNQGLVEY